MSAERPESQNLVEPHAANALTRRRVFAGAGAAGALVAVAAVVPLASKPTAPVQGEATERDAAADTGGYRLTDHVRRYYETARV